MIDIKINSASNRDIRIVGDERTPVITIDDAILSTDELVQCATQHSTFSSDSEFAYPGIRAALPAEYAEALVPELATLISEVYGTPPSYEHRLIHQLFSLVTQAPEDLGPFQRIPHFDNRSPFYFATVHYLSTEAHAGTGFFRHRPTSFERITEDRYQPYMQAAGAYVNANGLPAQKYINASDGHFELIAEVEHKPNRLVIYPGNLLHSGLIQPEQDISANPSSGRLTANLFLYFTDLSRPIPT